MTNLEQMTKEELQNEFQRVTGQPFKTAWTKAELIDMITNFKPDQTPDPNNGEGAPDPNEIQHTLTQTDIDVNAPGLDGLKPGDTIGIPVEAVADNEFVIVKENEDGEVIDRQTTTVDAWNLLPDHKFGWKRETPKEVQ